MVDTLVMLFTAVSLMVDTLVMLFASVMSLSDGQHCSYVAYFNVTNG